MEYSIEAYHSRAHTFVVDRPDDRRFVRLAHSVLGSADRDVDLVVVEDSRRLLVGCVRAKYQRSGMSDEPQPGLLVSDT